MNLSHRPCSNDRLTEPPLVPTDFNGDLLGTRMSESYEQSVTIPNSHVPNEHDLNHHLPDYLECGLVGGRVPYELLISYPPRAPDGQFRGSCTYGSCGLWSEAQG